MGHERSKEDRCEQVRERIPPRAVKSKMVRPTTGRGGSGRSLDDVDRTFASRARQRDEYELEAVNRLSHKLRYTHVRLSHGEAGLGRDSMTVSVKLRGYAADGDARGREK